MKTTSPFVSKYAPQTFSDIVFASDKTKAHLDLYVQGRKASHLILWGTNGVGKTSIAELLPKAIEKKDDVAVHRIESIDIKTNISRVIETMKNCQSLAKLNGHRYYAIVEELDFDHKNCSQFSTHIERIQADSMVIICTNQPMAISRAILSRCTAIEIAPATPQDFLARAKYILDQEGFGKLPDDILLQLLQEEEQHKDNRKYLDKLATLVAMTK